MPEYFIVDIETVPIDMGAYFECEEENRKDFLNPFDSKIIAAGIRAGGENKIFEDDEENLLEEFWLEWGTIKRGGESVKVVGFNVKEFDLQMLVRRSFRNEVTIRPFTLKEVVDLREKLSVYKWGAEGTLHDYAALGGFEPSTEDGSEVAQWAREGNMDAILDHLKDDLLLTGDLFERAKELNILKIDKW